MADRHCFGRDAPAQQVDEQVELGANLSDLQYRQGSVVGACRVVAWADACHVILDENAMKPLITDISEISRLSERNRKKDFDFRAKLKREIHDENRLDTIVHALYKEVSSQIDCRSCGNCCKAFDIIMDEADIDRLSKAVDTGADDFKSQYLKTAKDQAGLCFNTKPCPFLKENQCGVYESRPAVCREYPHIDKSEFLGRTWSAIDNCGTCPMVFNVWERLKSQKGLFKTSD